MGGVVVIYGSHLKLREKRHLMLLTEAGTEVEFEPGGSVTPNHDLSHALSSSKPVWRSGLPYGASQFLLSWLVSWSLKLSLFHARLKPWESLAL